MEGREGIGIIPEQTSTTGCKTVTKRQGEGADEKEGRKEGRGASQEHLFFKTREESVSLSPPIILRRRRRRHL